MYKFLLKRKSPIRIIYKLLIKILPILPITIPIITTRVETVVIQLPEMFLRARITITVTRITKTPTQIVIIVVRKFWPVRNWICIGCSQVIDPQSHCKQIGGGLTQPSSQSSDETRWVHRFSFDQNLAQGCDVVSGQTEGFDFGELLGGRMDV